MSLIKCKVENCRFNRNESCLARGIDVSNRDAIVNHETNCETFEKKTNKEEYNNEYAIISSFTDHNVACDAKNCAYNCMCKCEKDMIEIRDNKENKKIKMCESFRLKKE